MNFLYNIDYSIIFDFLNKLDFSVMVVVGLVNTVLESSTFYYSLGAVIGLGLISLASNAINKLGQGILTGTGIAIGKKLGDIVIDSVTKNPGNSSSGNSSGGSNTSSSGGSNTSSSK